MSPCIFEYVSMQILRYISIFLAIIVLPKFVGLLCHNWRRTYFGNVSNGTFQLDFPADTALDRQVQW